MIYEFYSGSYGKAEEEGIVKFRMDTEKQTITKLYGYRGIPNPSYLAFNPSKTILYAVQEEVPVGAVHALKVTDTGLVPLRKLSTEGADPCHVSLDGTGKLMFVDNYTSGSLAVFAMGADETPERLSRLMIHTGRSVHPTRQTAAHVHYTKEHGGKAFAADLGMDQVFIYDADPENGSLTDTGKRLSFPAGAGPRHLEFSRIHPGVLYVICELQNLVTVWREENGSFRLEQSLGTLPEEFKGESTAAAIKMQGDLMFASNRGHDSIAVYRAGKDGRLTLLSITPTGGKTPRDFTIFGDHIVIANQGSDSITVLKIDRETGNLEPTGMYAETVRPSCIRSYGTL